MATPSKVQLDTKHKAAWQVPSLSEESATKASELLQQNHEQHHIFFNKGGFHNHIAHHLLTIYALGATPEQLQRHYDNNAGYQRNPVPVHKKEVQAMADPAIFKKHLGDEDSYHDYLIFFQEKMDRKGWQTVVNEYLFAEDERANDMLVRLFSGFLHPIIHLGFGIEFNQPAIIAEALAQAAVHSNWLGKLLVPAEEASQKNPPPKGGKTLTQLLHEINKDTELKTAAHWSDGNKSRDGVLARAGDRMFSYATQYVVLPTNDLARKNAEMMNASALFTGTAQRPDKEVKFDFYFMHCVNCSIFYTAFLEQDWLSDAAKRRLVEWKGRVDLVMYASRRAPDMLVEEVKAYKPRQPGSDVVKRVLEIEDDGHTPKLVRAFAHGKAVCGKDSEYGETGEVTSDMWDKLLHMVVDSTEGLEERWIRSAGFDEAWEKVRDRSMASL